MVELVSEGGLLAGVGGVAAMEDTSYLTFGGFERDACRFTEQVHFTALGLEVFQGVGENSGIISIA